jgi:hypothetical protein
MLAQERWLPVVGYEGLYEVSNLGRVRSLTVRGHLRAIPHLMTPKVDRKNHLQLLLYKDGVRKDWSVHRLVLIAFVGPSPPGFDCCHYDGNPHNNRPENLRWDTRRANIEDQRRRGTMNHAKPGEDHHAAILWDDAVRAIRAEPYFIGVCRMLARCFDVTPGQIYRIRTGRSWAHLG